MKFPKLRLPKISRPSGFKLNTPPDLFWKWLPTAAVIVMFFGSTFIMIQQYARQSANDPQIEFADKLISDIKDVPTLPTQADATQRIEVDSNLSSFAILINEDFSLQFTTAFLDDQMPVPPNGVLEYAKTNGVNMLTWQPKPGVRLAIVVKYFSGENSGYIVVGRSLREIEGRTNRVLLISVIAAVLTLIVSLALTNLTQKPRTAKESIKKLAVNDRVALETNPEKPKAKKSAKVSKPKATPKKKTVSK